MRLRRPLFGLLLLLNVVFPIFTGQSQAQPPAAGGAPALGWLPEQFGAFVMTLCRDQNGAIWVGTEDNGVWRFDPQARTWQQWTLGKGLAEDSVYSLACDGKNRIWAGHGYNGVSVWNGTAWRNYDRTNGPLGERVFDIATSPVDGDVWLATSAGLARYHAEKEWLYYHRGTGMPANQISALAFDAQGTLYAATHCDGLAIASVADDFKSWRHIVSPFAKMPLTAAGRAFPGDILNDVLVTRNGTVYVASKNGLARSSDSGKTWAFLRGENWTARVEGLYENPAAEAPLPDVEAFRPAGALLAEDDIFCLAEDDNQRLWLGYQGKGVEVRDGTGNQRVYWSGDDPANNAPKEMVRAILPFPGAARGALFARYGGAVGGLGQVGKVTPAAANAPRANAPFPAAASAPDAARLAFLREKLKGAENNNNGGVYLGADWTTKGDWVGRYGQVVAEMSAVPSVRLLKPVAVGYHVGFSVGPHFKGNPSVYSYIQWLKSDNRNVLYNPILGLRRQGELNDGSWQGELYPATWEGPDLWVRVKVPEGVHRAALYFFNKDGHSTINRTRDHIVELKKAETDRNKADAAPVIARARVCDFWGGVYQNFALQGPSEYIFKITRQGANATTISGVFLSSLDAFPGYKDYEPPARETLEDETARGLVDLWMSAGQSSGPWRTEAQVQCYRAMAASEKYPNWLAKMRWQLPLWSDAERAEFDKFGVQNAAEVAARKVNK